MRQPAWLPTYDHVHLDFVHLDGDNIIHGTRHELLELCREHNIHRRSITPFSTRMGRGHVIQGTGSRRDNTVCLLNEDMEWGHYRILPPFLGYNPFLQFWDLVKLLEKLTEDYSEGTPTRALADAMMQSVGSGCRPRGPASAASTSGSSTRCLPCGSTR